MTDRDQGAAGGLPEPGSTGGESAWAADDLALDARARTLLLRLVERDDGAALAALIDLMEPRLLQLQEVVLDELGAGVNMPLADEWFAEYLVGSHQVSDVPKRPLAVALEWMRGRGQALVNALSAQPLPWEPGHEAHVLDHWFARLGVNTSPTPELRVQLVSHHRLAEATRQVLRDVQVLGLDVAACATKRGRSREQTSALLREGRFASVLALEQLQAHSGGSVRSTRDRAPRSVRQVLDTAGPSLAARFQELTSKGPLGAEPPESQAERLIQHVEEAKAQALGASGRIGARLLYEAARSCLAAVPDYASQVEWVEVPEPMSRLQSAYEHLRSRAAGPDRLDQLWPDLRIGPGPGLARECLRIARVLEPGLLALELQAGCVSMATGEWQDAARRFEAVLGCSNAEESLVHHAARNAMASLAAVDQLAGRHDLLERLSQVTRAGDVVAFFELEMAAADHHATAFDRAISRFVDESQAPEASIESRWVESRVAAWARSLGLEAQGLRDRLLERRP